MQAPPAVASEPKKTKHTANQQVVIHNSSNLRVLWIILAILLVPVVAIGGCCMIGIIGTAATSVSRTR